MESFIEMLPPVANKKKKKLFVIAFSVPYINNNSLFIQNNSFNNIDQ